jgi:Fe-S cluster biogenesis protein NfuA
MLEKKVIEVLEKIRPYLQKDGGDVEFVKVEGDTVYVKVIGACVNCSMFEMTLRNGIELAITSEIPEIKKVINVK